MLPTPQVAHMRQVGTSVLRAKEVGTLLGCSRSTAARLMASGRIVSVRLSSKHIVCTEEAVAAFIAASPVTGPPAHVPTAKPAPRRTASKTAPEVRPWDRTSAPTAKSA